MWRFWSHFVLALGLLCLNLPGRAFAEDAKADDNFFAGTVTFHSGVKLIVARVVGNQPESRTFKVTTQTKFEGKLSNKVRVTVRYITDDDGDTATLIVVRPPVPAPPQKIKK